MAYTFGAEDIIAALGLTATDWEIQDSGDNAQKDHAVTKSKVGAYVPASEVAHNERTDLTINLRCKVASGATADFTLGGAGTGVAPDTVVLTAFTLRESYNDHATLQVTAHKHDDGETGAVHLATPLSQSVSLTGLGFGVSAVRLGGTLLDCQSAELSGSVEHKDRYSNQGNFLVGASTGLRFEATEEYVDSGSVTVPSPWVEDSQDKKTVNEDFYTRSVKAHAYSLS